MIASFNDLRDYLRKDQINYNTSFRAWLMSYPSYYMGQYFKCLRVLEYLKNLENPLIALIAKPLKPLFIVMLRRYSYKLGGFQIGLNTCGPGIKVYHYGFIIINGKAKIGKNFSVQPGCVVGRTKTGEPIIGDNVYMAPNSTVMGNVTIGNNVTIAQNSSVVKDVPSNCIVGGVPAKILKYKNLKNNE